MGLEGLALLAGTFLAILAAACFAAYQWGGAKNQEKVKQWLAAEAKRAKADEAIRDEAGAGLDAFERGLRERDSGGLPPAA